MSGGAKPLVFKTQDPKYDINVIVNSDGEITDAYLVNSTTGVGIPVDEPIMLFRAKDKAAIGAISVYQMGFCELTQHHKSIEKILNNFTTFALKHPELMKEPDTE